MLKSKKLFYGNQEELPIYILQNKLPYLIRFLMKNINFINYFNRLVGFW